MKLLKEQKLSEKQLNNLQWAKEFMDKYEKKARTRSIEKFGYDIVGIDLERIEDGLRKYR